MGELGLFRDRFVREIPAGAVPRSSRQRDTRRFSSERQAKTKLPTKTTKADSVIGATIGSSKVLFVLRIGSIPPRRHLKYGARS